MRVNNLQKNKLKKIAESYNLKLIILFGSFACYKEREDSDMDIGVLANKEINLKEQLDIMASLQNILAITF